MKSKWVIILLLLTLNIKAGPGGAAVVSGSVLDGGTGGLLEQQRAAYALKEAQQEAQASYNAAMQEELNRIYSKDPWRKIGDSTNFARGTGWVEFQGKVEEATTDGAVFRGKWGPVLTVYTMVSGNEHYVSKSDSNAARKHQDGKTTYASSTINDQSFQRNILYGDDLFFVEDFPYPASTGAGYEKMMAFDSTYYSYTNSNGQLLTIHKLIYGRPCVKTWSAEEIAAAKQKVDSKKKLPKTSC